MISFFDGMIEFDDYKEKSLESEPKHIIDNFIQSRKFRGIHG
jgi:hypothetical protein